jgi:mRNA interferase MazF
VVILSYVPDQGDICWITLNPQSGHEQKGRRPALVVSNREYNKITGLSMCCPITNTDNEFPLHIKISGRTTTGFVMIEHLKSLDYTARQAEFIEKLDEDMLTEALSVLNACF